MQTYNVLLYFTQIVTDIRLVGGSSKSAGRVEFLLNGEWGSICDNTLTAMDSTVICRTLGYAAR